MGLEGEGVEEGEGWKEGPEEAGLRREGPQEAGKLEVFLSPC